jgi:branched-chain amino acid transport system ATP-binding protein
MSVPLLSVRDVSKRFGGLRAVDRVSFELGAGEVVGIIGPNGAGKTTLFNLLTGQVAPDSGEIRLRGALVNRLPPHRRARLGMGRTFQIARPLAGLSVLENAMIGAFARHPSLRAAEAQALRVLEEVGLADHAARRAGELTLSERRRLEVARALAMDPDLILLDEVMAGLNPSEVARAVTLYRALHRRGMTFLVIEHNLKVVRSFAERVIVLDHGAMIGEGRPEDILAMPTVIEAYVGRQRA